MTKEEMFNQNINIAYKLSQSYRINYPKEYDDIRQIALMTLWQAILKYDGRGALTTFAYPCIRNAINIYIRNLNKHNNEISLSTPIDKDFEISDTITDEIDYVEEIINEIELDQVREYSKHLPIYGRDKEIWNLYCDGLSQTKIAEKTKYSQSYISRILQNLKKIIAVNYFRKESGWMNQ